MLLNGVVRRYREKRCTPLCRVKIVYNNVVWSFIGFSRLGKYGTGSSGAGRRHGRDRFEQLRGYNKHHRLRHGASQPFSGSGELFERLL